MNVQKQIMDLIQLNQALSCSDKDKPIDENTNSLLLLSAIIHRRLR